MKGIEMHLFVCSWLIETAVASSVLTVLPSSSLLLPPSLSASSLLLL